GAAHGRDPVAATDPPLRASRRSRAGRAPTRSLRLHHAAGQPRAGVAGGLGGVVVRVGMHDDALADDVGGGAVAQGHAFETRVHRRHALGVGDDVVAVAAVVRAVADAAVIG